MAFRIKASTCLIFTAALAAQNLRYEVRHDHLRKGAPGVLAFSDQGVSFEESGKKAEHSRKWAYEEIQSLELRPSRVRILTYEDRARLLGRDREYTFDGLPAGAAVELYGMLTRRLDQRFVAWVADKSVTPLWSVPAKMLRGRSGSSGTLTVAAAHIVFDSPGESRTWRYSDIAGVTTENPLELTITSLDRETRFQLKQVLPEDRYNDLWRSISEANGLRAFHSSMEKNHD